MACGSLPNGDANPTRILMNDVTMKIKLEGDEVTDISESGQKTKLLLVILITIQK